MVHAPKTHNSHNVSQYCPLISNPTHPICRWMLSVETFHVLISGRDCIIIKLNNASNWTLSWDYFFIFISSLDLFYKIKWIVSTVLYGVASQIIVSFSSAKFILSRRILAGQKSRKADSQTDCLLAIVYALIAPGRLFHLYLSWFPNC